MECKENINNYKYIITLLVTILIHGMIGKGRGREGGKGEEGEMEKEKEKEENNFGIHSANQATFFPYFIYNLLLQNHQFVKLII